MTNEVVMQVKLLLHIKKENRITAMVTKTSQRVMRPNVAPLRHDVMLQLLLLCSRQRQMQRRCYETRSRRCRPSSGGRLTLIRGGGGDGGNSGCVMGGDNGGSGGARGQCGAIGQR